MPTSFRLQALHGRDDVGVFGVTLQCIHPDLHRLVTLALDPEHFAEMRRDLRILVGRCRLLQEIEGLVEIAANGASAVAGLSLAPGDKILLD